MQETEKLLSQTQLAAMLGVSERTVQRLVRRGVIPHERVGNTPVFRPHLVKAAINPTAPPNKE